MENKNNNFLHGLLLGAALGGGLVFLLGTKKGKRLLKVITDQGLDKVSDLATSFEDEFEDYAEEEDENESDSGKQKTSSTVSNQAEVNHDLPAKTVKDFRTTAKRLFKGIKKKTK